MGKLGRIYHPGCSQGDAKTYALAIVRAIQECGALTSHQLWDHAQAEGIRTKRQLKQFLRWMKQEHLVSTVELPAHGDNRVYKLPDRIRDDAISGVSAAAGRIETPEKEYKIDLGEIWLKNNPREQLTKYELRLQAREERRGLAPLMPFWDI
ncbi:hypothetical protein SELMODRAFT_448859 [Selaginella moellendorffii]|uniref:Uncharacterized protein n=1 Tax=Selaginella moellendorffii TaxID=88036 RepID=D8TAS4_SELML|nr:hypothetical protein SELMODRAFT_448859 [Selaginella moellendorffii]